MWGGTEQTSAWPSCPGPLHEELQRCIYRRPLYIFNVKEKGMDTREALLLRRFIAASEVPLRCLTRCSE